MELRHLKYFLATAHEGNMTRAAAACHVSQPALSRQLADLEKELGCELFVRGSRGVSLTNEGMMLRKRAQEIVELADRAEFEIRSDGAQVAGDIWVGAGESRVVSLLAKAAATLLESHPQIRLRLYSGNFDDVTERIERGLLDFGVLMGGDVGSRFDSIELPWEDRWGVLMRRDHPLAHRDVLTLDDLSEQRLIVSAQRHEGMGDDSFLELLSQRGMQVAATYTLLFNASLLVEAGVGMAVCFDGIVAAGEGTPFAFVPMADVPPVSSRLIWKKFQPFSRAAQLLLHTLQQMDS